MRNFMNDFGADFSNIKPMSVPVHKIQACFKICVLEFEQQLYFVDANVNLVVLHPEDADSVICP